MARGHECRGYRTQNRKPNGARRAGTAGGSCRQAWMTRVRVGRAGADVAFRLSADRGKAPAQAGESASGGRILPIRNLEYPLFLPLGIQMRGEISA